MNPAAVLSDQGLVILLFHGVVESSPYTVRNYTRKHLERDYFHRLMDRLARAGRPLAMDDVVAYHRAGEPFPPRSFAVTFDDGFENNYSIAAPILGDLDVPATFYVTTGFIQNNAMSWIDRIEYCLEVASAVRVRTPWDDRVHDCQCTQDKVRLLEYLRNRVKRDAAVDVDALTSDVFRQCGVGEILQSDDALDQKMNWKQVIRLQADGLLTIGGHTHQHRVLSFLSTVELDAEIRTSVDLCKRRAGIRLRHYSYPEGLAYSYSPEVIEALVRYGIVCCPTDEEGVNGPGDSLFHLKRIAPVPAPECLKGGPSPTCVA